jgi:hypothetical protein
MKSRIHVILLLAISVTVLIPFAVSNFVYAQPCTATLSSPVIPTEYGNSNVPFVIPIEASCTTYYSQLYATGNAYDATSNIGLGTANTVLSPVNGGTQFNGQLGFSVPPTSPSDSVQVSVSIYNSQGGYLITQTSETIQLGAETQQPLQQIVTTTVTVGQYPYVNPSPIEYESPYQPNQSQYYPNQLPSQQGNQSHHWYYFSQGFSYRSNNQYFFDWVAIVAILATVIIATAGLVLIARRPQPQPVWYPMPPSSR